MDDMDIEAFRQMVAKNPKGFLGRYGLGNKIIEPGEEVGCAQGDIQCHESLGGLLRYYHRAA